MTDAPCTSGFMVPWTQAREARVLHRLPKRRGRDLGRIFQAVAVKQLGPLAQRSEQRTHNPLVEGSNPSGPTIESTGLYALNGADGLQLADCFSPGMKGMAERHRGKSPQQRRPATWRKNRFTAYK